MMKDDRRTANIDTDILKLLFNRVCLYRQSVQTITNSEISFARNALRSATMTDRLIATSVVQWTTYVRI